MSVRSEAAGWWRVWALGPLVVLGAVVVAFGAFGDSVTDLLGRTPPPADTFDVRRVEFHPGEIRVKVTNPQREELTVASVTVDDAIVPFRLDGPATLGRLRSTTVVVPYRWVENDPISVGITSSSGIETVEEVAAAVETPGPSLKGAFGYALVGMLVGIVPVALGLLWLPSLRRASPKWLAAFMALTAGLLTFLGVEALSEALELQGELPGPLGGAGLVLLGVAASWLGLTAVSRSFAARSKRGQTPSGPASLPVTDSRALGGLALGSLVAIGIGLHNLGEGLAIGTSFAVGELSLGTFLIIGFMVHNVTEGLGIAAPIAEGRRTASASRLAALALVAGAPTIVGAWLGGYLTSDVLSVVFFAVAAGAAFQVIGEVGRYLGRRAPGGLSSTPVLSGFLAGIAVMYVTGVFAG
jgi:zinc transporter ZupT